MNITIAYLPFLGVYLPPLVCICHFWCVKRNTRPTIWVEQPRHPENGLAKKGIPYTVYRYRAACLMYSVGQADLYSRLVPFVCICSARGTVVMFFSCGCLLSRGLNESGLPIKLSF